MKKMYFLTIALIFAITILFLMFSTDIDRINLKFLASYGIHADKEPVSAEMFVIPMEFDGYYQSYNIMQIESGLNLAPHAGKSALKCTYRISGAQEIFANVICVNRRPVAGDIVNPAMDGFIIPLSRWRQIEK